MHILSIFFLALFRVFLLLTFFRGIFESRHQQIWNQHKIRQLLVLCSQNRMDFRSFNRSLINMYFVFYDQGLNRRGIILYEAKSNVWRLSKYWPPTPHRPANVYPPPLVRGEDTLAEWRGGGGSIVRKTPDSALYSIYVSTLWPKWHP